MNDYIKKVVRCYFLDATDEKILELIEILSRKNGHTFCSFLSLIAMLEEFKSVTIHPASIRARVQRLSDHGILKWIKPHKTRYFFINQDLDLSRNIVLPPLTRKRKIKETACSEAAR